MKVELVDKEGHDLAAEEEAGSAALPLPPGLPAAHAREGESRRQTWERLRREARAAGMTRKASLFYATMQADRFHPHFEPLPEPEPTPEPPPDPEPVEPDPPPVPEAEAQPTATGVPGLADLPADWPSLPANASLAAEVGWVQANRLRVVQEGMVDLSRSLSPAPSHAALAWLETSLLFPAKWADVTVKASQGQADDQAEVRREKLALVDVGRLLGEMAEAGAT